jgi:putative metalloenzyme radical SAM/SPASM domain maturase
MKHHTAAPVRHIPAPGAPALREYPTKLFVETTTRCNLNCFMCVKQNQGNGICDGDLTPALFEALAPAFPNLEALILNGIGEPLLNPHLENFIRSAKKLMPRDGWVGFQSNGLLVTNLNAVSLIDAGLDQICLSIDAVSPEKFREVRCGGELEGVEKALASFTYARDLCNRPDFRIGVEFVVMQSNLHELPDALAWAARRGASFAIVTHVLPYDECHAHEAAFGECTDEAIRLFRKWKEQGESQGIDIARYYEVRFHRYARNPEEQAIVNLVEGLKAEAELQGTLIDVKKLLKLDYDRLTAVSAVFATAREVADAAGLELRLPEVSLREQRKCSFVEEGSAFVSWQGEISPCYFLWHRFSCFASGWSQSVQPKVFGSLAEQNILDIWNSKEFLEFRCEVLAYDYPTCASCSLAPCDYVQTEKFEQDCHIRSVPCGSCLWCTGVFQCLR